MTHPFLQMAKRLSNVKSSLGFNNSKKKMAPRKVSSNELNRLRAAQRIEAENAKLGNRLMAAGIEGPSSRTAPRPLKFANSNALNRKRAAERIQAENHKMVQRMTQGSSGLTMNNRTAGRRGVGSRRNSVSDGGEGEDRMEAMWKEARQSQANWGSWGNAEWTSSD